MSDASTNSAVRRRVEVRCDSIATMDGTVEAGVNLAMPVVRLRLDEALAQRDAGIVNEDIESAEILDDPVDHRLHSGKIGHVGPVGLRLCTIRRNLGNQGFCLLS